MPVIFSTPTSHRVFMFDKDAVKILQTINTSGSIPGALFPEAIPDALEALQDSIKLELNIDEEQSTDDNNYVSLQKKTLPLIELMQRAIDQNEKLIWDNG